MNDLVCFLLFVFGFLFRNKRMYNFKIMKILFIRKCLTNEVGVNLALRLFKWLQLKNVSYPSSRVIRRMSDPKILLTRNSTLATISNGLIFLYKSSKLKIIWGFHMQKEYYRQQIININEIECLKTDVTITTCVQK